MLEIKKQSLSEIFSIYFDNRMFKILLLGAISGFPWVLIGSSLSLWLKEDGLSRSTIGWAGLIFGVYGFNYLWAPIVDRIQIARYPENTGFCELHSHPPKNQRLIISVYMSEIKKDYLLGGTHFFKKKKKIKVEHKITKGDVGIFYSTLYHGVDPVKLSKYQKSKLNPGRWWCGLYSPESNHFKKRHTSSPARKIN